MHAYAHTLGQEILKEREREREHVKHNKKEKKKEQVTTSKLVCRR